MQFVDLRGDVVGGVDKVTGSAGEHRYRRPVHSGLSEKIENDISGPRGRSVSMGWRSGNVVEHAGCLPIDREPEPSDMISVNLYERHVCLDDKQGRNLCDPPVADPPNVVAGGSPVLYLTSAGPRYTHYPCFALSKPDGFYLDGAQNGEP